MLQRWYKFSLGVRLAIIALAFCGAMGASEWWAREHGDQLPRWVLHDSGAVILTAQW